MPEPSLDSDRLTAVTRIRRVQLAVGDGGAVMVR